MSVHIEAKDGEIADTVLLPGILLGQNYAGKLFGKCLLLYKGSKYVRLYRNLQGKKNLCAGNRYGAAVNINLCKRVICLLRCSNCSTHWNLRCRSCIDQGERRYNSPKRLYRFCKSSSALWSPALCALCRFFIAEQGV